MYAPSFDVILAVKDSAKYLEGFFDSYVKQTYNRKRLIVIDGGSQDGSTDIIDQYREIIDVYQCCQDSSIYTAWNRALRQSSGEWLVFLGADDRFVSMDTFDIVARDIHASKTNINLITYLAQQGPRVVGGLIEKESFDCGGSLKVCHAGAFHRATLFKHSQFDETYKIVGDYDFLLRKLVEIRQHHSNLVLFDIGSTGISTALSALYLREGWFLYCRYAKFQSLSAVLWIARQFLRLLKAQIRSH